MRLTVRLADPFSISNVCEKKALALALVLLMEYDIEDREVALLYLAEMGEIHGVVVGAVLDEVRPQCLLLDAHFEGLLHSYAALSGYKVPDVEL
jgi:hypothetical protein